MGLRSADLVTVGLACFLFPSKYEALASTVSSKTSELSALRAVAIDGFVRPRLTPHASVAALFEDHLIIVQGACVCSPPEHEGWICRHRLCFDGIEE